MGYERRRRLKSSAPSRGPGADGGGAPQRLSSGVNVGRTMSIVSGILEADVQRKLAAGLFNRAWDLMDKAERSRAEAFEMVHAAHASRLLWEEIGDASNHAVGEWQVSRVHAALGQADPSVFHARRCVELVEREGFEGFLRASAYEGMARALSVAGETEECQRYLQRAREEGERIASAEERDLLFSQLREVPGFRD